jgi:Protein of unknown function (DUF2474)
MKPHVTDVGPTRWARRVGWLLLIWLASVLALGVIAGVFRWIMAAAGLTR